MCEEPGVKGYEAMETVTNIIPKYIKFNYVRKKTQTLYFLQPSESSVYRFETSDALSNQPFIDKET